MAYNDVPASPSTSTNNGISMPPERFATVPYWSKFSFLHSDLQTAALTNAISMFTLPAAWAIEKIIVKPSVAFAGTLTYTLSVGVAGTPAKYVLAYDAKQAVSGTAFGIMGVTMNYGIESFSAATPIVLAATSTLNLLSASTAGAVDIWVRTSALTI